MLLLKKALTEREGLRIRKKTTAGKERTRRQLEQTIAAYQKLAEEDWLAGLFNGQCLAELWRRRRANT